MTWQSATWEDCIDLKVIFLFIVSEADYYMVGTLHTKVLQEIQQSLLYLQELKGPLLQRSIHMQHMDPGYRYFIFIFCISE